MPTSPLMASSSKYFLPLNSLTSRLSVREREDANNQKSDSNHGFRKLRRYDGMTYCRAAG